ncbi:enoyl-CoA hydratase-related protein [Micromonospora sp. DR5-3]|uniref:enoyl-CoA hydratase/isomerase family protein n=1 Tax=unclassified Micromonospora TaxID=2617518 RepID=UPI0011D3DB42|nr:MULTISPECIES: enoyl-CoA hydratase-related protein [unclassified Micromonospora]MCW3819095.1 enoyl-CoA hydratase-related protein [Micromonospora sp. DR5-3]TYC20358.1 enoyl-CoA hydratase [Micromonospora sp. MP36]
MTVRHERHGQVMVFTIDRPRVRNCLDHATLSALTAGLTAAATDPEVRAAVLTATGERAFSAGLDLKAVAEAGMPDPATSPLHLLRDGYPLPVIAAVNGAAVGGGFELALACDLRVAAEHAYFALPEVSLGIAATEGGTELPQRVPLAVALEIGLAGEPLGAARAYELGLVNRVVPAVELLPAALALAERVAGHSPAAVRATKDLMYRSLSMDPASLRARNRAATVALLAGPDAAEGMAAFVEKRAPRWAAPAPDAPGGPVPDAAGPGER